MSKLKKAARQTGIKQIAIGRRIGKLGLQNAVHTEAAKAGWEVFIPASAFPSTMQAW